MSKKSSKRNGNGANGGNNNNGFDPKRMASELGGLMRVQGKRAKSKFGGLTSGQRRAVLNINPNLQVLGK